MIYTTDDLCLEYLDNFKYFDEIKAEFPDFKLIAFTISNFKNKESLKDSQIFKDFIIKRPWIEIAVHSYDHDEIPDGDREDEGLWIKKALDELKEFLPQEYGYRSPGWQTTNKTESILRQLGFSYIAYQDKIKYFNFNKLEYGVVNSHIYDINSIKNLYETLQNNSRQKS
jgi:peptidoglycan/xylan/chitin deacetylase (PgdA/CDA1 family)